VHPRNDAVADCISPRIVATVEKQACRALRDAVTPMTGPKVAVRDSLPRSDEVTARENEIADELQASLLPGDTFELECLEVAACYRAGVAGTQVGGDWYDVIELPEGRVALVVGDVMGRGVQAAVVMAQLRTAVRAYAQIGLTPDGLMGSLDHLVRERFPEQVVTCVYAVFDPADLSLRFVNAGHPPLLEIDPDGSCTRVTVATHPPLGVGRPFCEVYQIDLAPGAGVVLYTDGLVESREETIEAGIESLREAVAGLDVPLREVPEALVRAQLPHGTDDDVAILVARLGR
jgi:serine phosphatase RsbU (regulator of sigma subunit)